MLRKRLFYFAITLALMAASCDNNDVVVNHADSESAVGAALSEAQAQEKFAITLSKAVYKSSELRAFLKANALKQFNNNYEVFYPYVKNENVKDGKTFRQLLVEHSSEGEMAAIEKATPLLTVFIPDLSMFGAFNVNTWDVSQPDVLVTYEEGNKNTIFYENGEEEFSLPDREVPAFPFLLVKSTDRMKVVGTTRSNGSSEPVYDFAHEIFRPQPSTRAKWTHSIVKNDTLPADNYISKDLLAPEIIEAYNKCKGDVYSLQRDYIYYGMSPSNPTNGRLRPDMRERMVKFKVNPSTLERISDYKNNLDGDPYLKEARFRKGDPSLADIIKNIWHNGKFTFIFNFYGATRTQTMSPVQITFDVSATEVFHIDRLHRAYRHATAFRKSRYHYTVEVSDLSSKWINVPKGEGIILPSPWDLSELSTNIYVTAIEFDESQKRSTTVSFSSTFAQKGNFGIGAELGIIKLNLGLGLDHSQSRTNSVTIEQTNASDDLGACYINYTDKIIVSDDKASQGLYKIKTYGTGSVEFMIIPTKE